MNLEITTKAKKVIKIKLVNVMLIAFVITLVLSCSNADKTKEFKTAEEYFKYGLKLFNEEEYVEANKIFEVIKLQYAASQYADDAQYYLAEINFKRKEFILSAFNYGSIRRIYPHSEYAKIALYKTAMCFYNLSPQFERDQDYTLRAMQTFAEYQLLYPNDTLQKNCNAYIEEMRNKLAEREFFTAGIYNKLYSPHSALIYFDSVIENFTDTKYLEPAYFGKIQMLFEMKKIDEARSIVEIYKKLFPNGTNIDKVKSIESQLSARK